MPRLNSEIKYSVLGSRKCILAEIDASPQARGTLLDKVKGPDRQLTRLIRQGWGVVATSRLAQLIHAARWW